jgi:CHAT domain-containing protein/tetratricopeptide (TPR) repeat protein
VKETFLVSFSALSIVILVGCQTTPATMSVEEAKSFKADFQISQFSEMPRDTEKLRLGFGSGGPVPDNCSVVRKSRRDRLDGIVSRLKQFTSEEDRGNTAKSLNVAAENSMASGYFEEALKQTEYGLSVILHPQRTAALRATRARMFAQMGNIEDAETEMQRFANGFHGGWAQWLDRPHGKAFYFTGHAAIEHARGNLRLAESNYRQALYNANFLYRDAYIDKTQLRSPLARILLQQNRLVEAEAEARKAVSDADVIGRALRARKKVHETEYYTGRKAGPIVVLAEVFLAQGRLVDAAYLAGIAINMHEVGCSDPTSLGLIQARATLISIYAQQEKWSLALKQFEIARGSLSEFPAQFNRLFGVTLDFIETKIYAGDKAEGLRLLKERLRLARQDKTADPVDVSILEGLIALAEVRKGNRKHAVELFNAALPQIINGGDGGEHKSASANLAGRKKRILSGYLETLNSLVDEGVTEIAGTNIPAELLRIASTTRLGRVQQAFSASHVRAASGDVELSKLVRQEQDLAEEVRTITETLAYLSYSPAAADGKISTVKLNKRSHDLTLARRALKSEIQSRFPEYADFTNPRPMTVAEMANTLKPTQALVAYHVTQQKTFIWAVKHTGKVVFATRNTGEESLFEKVKLLRSAVDPGPMGTLKDIPNFDVSLSNEVYELLLAPVRAGWQGASELLIVPDGPLGALPFSMLATSPDISVDDAGTLFSRYRNVAWLVNDIAITYLPSINTLKGISAKKVTKKSSAGAETSSETARPPKNNEGSRRPFVGIGDPFFTYKDTLNATEVATRGLPFRAAPSTRSVDRADLALLPRLPGTRSEILSIASTLGANINEDVLLGGQATEQAVKAFDLARYDVVSFATHGLVPGDLNGLDQPALALTVPTLSDKGATTGNEGDGLLTMSEILGLRLNAKFAVLSACNTAAADGKGAEAVSGLGRAFFYAGARAILVSNWPVHSAATTDLMSNLFGNMAKDRTLTRSEALRQTKLAQINVGGYRDDGKLLFSYAHPIFWAPFSIVGDGGRNKSG